MNRRGLLALLGGAVAMPGTVGAKTSAAIMGIDPHPPAAMPIDQVSEACGNTPSVNGWWGSPSQIAFDATKSAAYEAAQHDRYAHMKSWGPAFRRSVITREIQIERMFEQKCQNDAAFMDKIMGLLK